MNMTIEEIQAEITALKSLLRDTDYNSNKIIEDLVEVMSTATAMNFITKFVAWIKSALEEYGEVVRNRIMWRERINELEKLLENSTENPDESAGVN